MDKRRENKLKDNEHREKMTKFYLLLTLVTKLKNVKFDIEHMWHTFHFVPNQFNL